MYNNKYKNQTQNYDITKFVNNHMFVVKDMKEINAIPDAWAFSAGKYPNEIAMKDDYSGLRLTYKEVYNRICIAAAALQHIGVTKFSHVSFFSENSSKWMIMDQAVMKCGGVNSVRSSNAPLDELKYIYEHSDSCALFTDSKKLIKNFYSYLEEQKTKFIIYIGNDDISAIETTSVPIYTFEQIIEIGSDKDFTYTKLHKEDLATIVYSSGTTGRPKGIMLTNGNLVSQLFGIHDGAIEVKVRATVLSVLPVWHMYERTVEYYVFYCGGTLCYTNIRNFKKDINKFKPDIMVGVPRLWESIYETIMGQLKNKSKLERSIFNGFVNVAKCYRKYKHLMEGKYVSTQKLTRCQKLRAMAAVAYLLPVNRIAHELIFRRIKKNLGGKFPKCISGGGALCAEMEEFFDAIGMRLSVGYGLTETSPILTVRRFDDNRLFTSGTPLSETEVAIVDPDKMTLMPRGQKGLVLAKGPQVMKGYYKDQDATDKVILKTGWFITGDLGWMSEDNFLTLTGRAKDIIVLSNGENIEPDPIEQTCCLSDYVKQIVLVGQDKSCLGALVKLDDDSVVKWAQENGVKEATAKQDPVFKKMLLKELNDRISARPNFRPFERLGHIRFIEEGFTIENGLMTFTAKIRKNVVFDKYEKLINDMYKL